MPKQIIPTGKSYLIFYDDFDDHADEYNTIAFRADNRHPNTVFPLGFSPREESDAITFRPVQGDVDPSGVVCVSTDPAVAATFPLSKADGRYTPTWLYAIFVKTGVWVAATNQLSAGRGDHMAWARELAVLTVASQDVICAFSVSRRYDAFKIQSAQRDVIHRAAFNGPHRYFAARAMVAAMRDQWIPFPNVGGAINSELAKRRGFFEANRPS